MPECNPAPIVTKLTGRSLSGLRHCSPAGCRQGAVYLNVGFMIFCRQSPLYTTPLEEYGNTMPYFAMHYANQQSPIIDHMTFHHHSRTASGRSTSNRTTRLQIGRIHGSGMPACSATQCRPTSAPQPPPLSQSVAPSCRELLPAFPANRLAA